MNRFLLDTNICIYFNKKLHGVGERMLTEGLENCFISEITFAELLFGVENSVNVKRNMESLDTFMIDIQLIPISGCLKVFASEKARLRSIGKPLPDFDLLIGATAIAHNMTLVTNNTKHFQRLNGIKLADWTR